MGYRTGIIGTGFGAQVHAPLLMKHPDFDVVALSSIRPGRAEKIAQVAGIPHAFDDWRRMIEETPLDVVVVASQPALHLDMTRFALQSGLHVLCEKPPALHGSEVSEMQSLAQICDRIVAMNFEWRYLPERQAVKQLLQDGAIGEIFHVDWSEARPLWPKIKEEPYGWQWEADSGGGMLGAIGSHMIDALYHWFGPVSRNVNGFTKNHVHERRNGSGYTSTNAEDSFLMNGEFENGTTFSLQFIAAAVGRAPRIEIFGSEGTLILEGTNLSMALLGQNDFVPVPMKAPMDASSFPKEIRGYVHAQWMLYNDLSAALSGAEPVDLPGLNSAAVVQGIMDQVRANRGSQGVEGVRGRSDVNRARAGRRPAGAITEK